MASGSNLPASPNILKVQFLLLKNRIFGQRHLVCIKVSRWSAMWLEDQETGGVD
jgi:hypothetical protein